MLFIVGVGMAVLGVALCVAVQNELTLPFGRRLKVKPARIAGGFLIAFMPTLLVLYILLRFLPLPEITAPVYELMNWTLLLVCFFGAIVVLWRGSAPPKTPSPPEHPTVMEQATEPFSPEYLENDPIAQHARDRRKNPFDCS